MKATDQTREAAHPRKKIVLAFVESHGVTSPHGKRKDIEEGRDRCFQGAAIQEHQQEFQDCRSVRADTTTE